MILYHIIPDNREHQQGLVDRLRPILVNNSQVGYIVTLGYPSPDWYNFSS